MNGRDLQPPSLASNLESLLKRVGARIPASVTPSTRIEIHPSEWIELANEVADLRERLVHETKAGNAHCPKCGEPHVRRGDVYGVCPYKSSEEVAGVSVAPCGCAVRVDGFKVWCGRHWAERDSENGNGFAEDPEHDRLKSLKGHK